jgi:adenine-specific DNA-methyltransferase
LALKLDKDLIKLLLSNKKIKEHFFTEVEGTLIFDKEKFMKFVDNKEFLPDSYTAFKNKIGLTADKTYIAKSKEVVLAWPYKDCVLEGGQEKEDEKRREIFHNEILAPDEIDRLLDPKVFTNFKRIDAKGEHKVKEIKPNDNLIIKGNNLLVLHSLKKRFAGKVKLIYIDPPYNTGGSKETFTYNNNFNHSTWLTFMKNRLEVAKELLRDDGFIAIAIDHVELFYLGVLADEIFGRNNRLGVITVVHQARGRWMDKNFSVSNEFMLVYSKKEGTNIRNVVIDEKKKEQFNLEDEKGRYCLKNYIVVQGGGGGVTRKDKPDFWYPIYVSKDLKKVSLEKKEGYEKVLPITNSGRELTWVTKADTFIDRYNKGEIVIKREQGKIVIYRKFREQQIIPTHWIGPRYNATSHGTLLLEKIIGRKGVSYPKSLYTVLDIIKLTTSDDDIVLDFFAGSGTTGHAVLELNKEDGGNRKFILVEQLDEHIKICKERIQKVIQNLGKQKSLNNYNKKLDFVSYQLKELNEQFVQKIQKAKDSKELLKIWEEMKQHAFLSYRVDPKLFDENIEEFKKLSAEEQKKLLIECLDHNHLYVNYSEMKDTQYKISKEDIGLNNKFYGKL